MRLLFFILLAGCTGTISAPSVYTISRKFSPEPAVEESTRKALARWAASTGIELGIAETGIPVTTQEDWIYLDGKSNCGRMDFVNKEITVTTKREKCEYFSFDSLILHEIGHAIAGVGGHAVSGIMAEGGKAENRECIDENSLELICRTADCEVFEPECD